MNGLIGLCRKQLVESRWLLGLSCLAFFGLSWFSVYRTAGVETLLAGDFSERQLRTRGIMRALGGPSMDFSSTAIEMVMLTLPSLGVPLLLTIIWAISRGTGAVAGDLERFKKFIEERGQATGAWRGEIHGGQVESKG